MSKHGFFFILTSCLSVLFHTSLSAQEVYPWLEKTVWKQKVNCDNGTFQKNNCSSVEKRFQKFVVAVNRKPSAEVKFWTQVNQYNHPDGYRLYLRYVSSGAYTADAEQSLDELLFSEANSVQDPKKRKNALEAYLSGVHRKQFSAQAQTSLNELNERFLWEEILRGTSEKRYYQNFLNQFPRGVYARVAGDSLRAISQRETNSFLRLKKSALLASPNHKDLVGMYDQFEKKYPDGDFRDSAGYYLQLAADKLWMACLTGRSEAFCRELSQYYPNHPRANEAHELLLYMEAENVLWARCETYPSSSVFSEYLSRYPVGRFANSASQKLAECRLWESLAEKGQPQASEVYLRSHPAGLFSQHAWEEIAFSYLHPNDPVSLERFLLDFPQGRYAPQVLSAFQALEAKAWKEAEVSGTAAGFQQFLQSFPRSSRAQAARQRIAGFGERDAWSNAERSADPFVLQQFIDSYPQSNFRVQAESLKLKLEDSAEWKRAINQNSPQAYQNYLNRFPAGGFVQSARDRLLILDEDAWRQAVTAHNQDGYQAYIALFPRGKYHAQAVKALNTLMENEVWLFAKEADHPEAYFNYLVTYPTGRFFREAELRYGWLAEQKEWETAIKVNSEDACKEYLAYFPEGRYAALALDCVKSHRDTAAWDSAVSINKTFAYRSYLTRFSTGAFVVKARQALSQLEERAWAAIRNATSPAAFETFLKEFPDGKYASQASARMNELKDTAAWAGASSKNTPQAFRQYLSAFPNGKYVSQARSSLHNLDNKQWQQALTLNSLSAFRAYLVDFPEGLFESNAKNAILSLDRASWAILNTSGKLSDLQAYIRDFPDGEKIGVAKAYLPEWEDWQRALDQNLPVLYKAFLAKYPGSRYYKEALQRSGTQSPPAGPGDKLVLPPSQDSEKKGGF